MYIYVHTYLHMAIKWTASPCSRICCPCASHHLVGNLTFNLCRPSPPPRPLHFRLALLSHPYTAIAQTQTGLLIQFILNIRDAYHVGRSIDGKPTVRSFSLRECQALSVQQTARSQSTQAPPLTRCETNALTAHRAIAKAFKDKTRNKTLKSKGNTRAWLLLRHDDNLLLFAQSMGVFRYIQTDS